MKGGNNVKNEILRNLTYGMFAIGVKDGEKVSACIINSVTQITSGNKVHIAITINKDSYSTACIKKSGMFTVSVLSQDTPGSCIGALGLVSGKKTNKLKSIRHKILLEGVPVIKENTCCWLLCNTVSTFDFENQSFIVGEVMAGSDVSVGTPMTYDYYINILRGNVAMDSPISIPADRTYNNMGSGGFACSVCGYVYNDSNFGFEELQSDWVCPVCQMPKSVFVRNKE